MNANPRTRTILSEEDAQRVGQLLTEAARMLNGEDELRQVALLIGHRLSATSGEAIIETYRRPR